ncbi:SDR family NAD(P)-dependent oxidoreductase [Thiomicrorhabdus heinhorstiae]|uniref:SDR family NAD(P)-dependent oxidoreductase n=1 Tax=Thiomicrorhabdus heinhorstiae TaxID=2748010 RepID=A0ABS0BVT3_9GAMM|nr:SDR family NAD(P)-dependent oxidoreductase [Thiomicrorhabdus heinhorstiae]MBF6057904.1 SDR family NAD(P)-dependent oxidoreductase [Thiomicrorhabdus heinhorstiae]
MNTSLKPPSSILITGCSSGIGRHCAIHLHQLGYQVIASARKAEDVEQLRKEGLSCVQMDISDSHSVRQGLEEALQLTGGKLDALFNNAAFGVPGAVEDLSREAMRFQFETNVFGTQELTNLVIPIMRRQGYGKVLYNSSILGFAAMQYRGAYNASKFAIEGFADTLRLEVKKDNIQVVLIEPGPIISQFRSNAFAQFKRWIRPENSDHHAQYQAMINRLETVGPSAPFTLGPEAVTAAVVDALQKKRAAIRYPVTVPTRIFAVLKRILPTRLLDRVLIKAGGDGKR